MPSRPPLPNRELALSSALDRAVRTASVPPHVRALLSRVPVPLSVSMELPDELAAISLATRQILKLASTSETIHLSHLALGRPAARLELSAAGRTVVLETEALDRDLEVIARDALLALFSPVELQLVAEAFAAQSSRLESLHALTTLMLQAKDLDRALSVMLSGVTSGEGLAMNRAALFLRDEARGVYVGSKAIGPYDAQEAHRIWEAIEVEGKTMEHLVLDHAASNTDGRFQEFVETLELAPTGRPDDELLLAERASDPTRFSRSEAVNPTLGRLGVTGQYVVHVIRLRETIMGLLLCDNVYSNAPILQDQLDALASFIAQSALVWQNLSLLHKVEELARHDPLTGLLNRRALEARLDEESARALRNQRPLSVLVLDLDEFKLVNDRFGHAAGDAALRAIGAILKSTLRAGDHAGRFGGDEFVVLLPETSESEALVVARRIGQNARREGALLSLGGATWPTTSPRLDQILALADQSLYDAKRGGRARGHFAGGAVIGPFDGTSGDP